MGASGSGKSTLMHLLAGLDTPTEGTVTLAGRALERAAATASWRACAARGWGSSSSRSTSCPSSRAEENITLPCDITGAAIDRPWLEELLVAVSSCRTGGGTGRPSCRAASSSASRSRGRSSPGPAVVFADEPTGNLDSETSEEILALLRRAVDQYGQTVVMVTHDPVAAGHADRVVFLADGRVVDDRRGRAAGRAARRGQGAPGVIRLVLRGVVARRGRAALTALAVLVGVAMIAGTLAFTDAVRSSFDGLFRAATQGADAVVSPERVGVDARRGTITPQVARRVRRGARRRARSRARSPTPPPCSTAAAGPSAAARCRPWRCPSCPSASRRSKVERRPAAPAGGRGRARPGHGEERRGRVGDRVAVATGEPGAALPAGRDRALRRRGLARDGLRAARLHDPGRRSAPLQPPRPGRPPRGAR